MAFIILGDEQQEWERRPLRQAMTIGRSFDCDLPVRDTLLSRKHCRLEPHGNQWVLIDLKSRNGTMIGGERIARQVLEDGDVIRIGQTRVCFRAGAFVAAIAPNPAPSRVRPLDPHEAMAATMTGAEFAVTTQEPSPARFPKPKPKPAEPKSFQKEGVDMLVSKIASGTWDSRLASQALNRRPSQPLPWPNNISPPAQPVKAKSTDTTKPGRWLVMAYLIMACTVFTAAIYTIVRPGI